MRLHANAALSLSRRRLLCQRVVEQEWDADAGGWVATARRVSSVCFDRSSAPGRVANRTDERRIEAIAALRSRHR
jgi:hypothetical protein